MDGLIVKKKWLDFILDDLKPWEIRSSNTNKRGYIYLIESGSGLIKGRCELGQSGRVDDFGGLKGAYEYHRLEEHDIKSLKYKDPHIWLLRNPRRFKDPIPYKHPQGAVIWVKDPLKEGENERPKM